MICPRLSVIVVLSITVVSQLCTHTNGKYVRRTSRVIEEVDQPDVIVDYGDSIAEDDQVDGEIAEVGFVEEPIIEVEEPIDIAVEEPIDTEVEEPIDTVIEEPIDTVIEDPIDVDVGEPSDEDVGADEESNEVDEGQCPPMNCPEGSFVKQDCTCTLPGEDPCNACPMGTRCQKFPELMCIDCNCGFCDSSGSSCCTAGGANSCTLDNTACATQDKENFPAFLSTDNICDGVETADSVVPFGCGCMISDTTPCTYDPALQEEYEDRCYICTSKDIAHGKCPDCEECLKECNDSCIDEAIAGSNPYSFLEPFSECLRTMDPECRKECNEACKKLPEKDPFEDFKEKLSDAIEDMDIDEMIKKFGDTFGIEESMLYAVLPFAFLITGSMLIGCWCKGRK